MEQTTAIITQTPRGYFITIGKLDPAPLFAAEAEKMVNEPTATKLPEIREGLEAGGLPVIAAWFIFI